MRYFLRLNWFVIHFQSNGDYNLICSWQRPLTRSRSFGDMLCKSPSFQMFTQIVEKPRELRSPRQRRITVGESGTAQLNLTVYRHAFKKPPTSQPCFLCAYMQHHTCLWAPIWMETTLRRYYNHQSRAFRVASAHSPEPLQLQNTICLYFPAPLICQSNDSANSLRILGFVSRICQARWLVSLAIMCSLKNKTQRKHKNLFVHGLHLISLYVVIFSGNPSLTHESFM